MVPEAMKASSSGSSCGVGGLWHYYAAVGNREAKLATLLEFLQALRCSGRLPVAVCCSSRDALDTVVCALLRIRSLAVTAIHSDLTEKERELALGSFRRSAFGTASGASTSSGPHSAAAADTYREPEQVMSALVITDVCLKALPKELLPVGVSLLVEYDLPQSKEVYTRRVSALFGGGRDRRSQRCVVIDMVEAGAIAAFRTLEGFAASPVQEMPVRIEDMLVQ